jgi:very-short-patch-repair endonuclease
MSESTENTAIAATLESSRQALLDLSARNRLLAMPLGKNTSKSLEVLNERSNDIYRLLVTEKKSMRFLPQLPQPSPSGHRDTAVSPAEEKDKGYLDNKLQTKLDKDQLEKRLLAMSRNAQTIIEEQGVNILYLTLGSLTWIDQEKSTPRHAPLLIVPVQLLRQTARQQFTLKWSQMDVEGNLSLQAKLKHDWGIDLPLPEIDENFQPSIYFAQVAETISSLSGWSVNPDCIVLGFFSFSKFLMYKDLDPTNWPEPSYLTEALSRILQMGYTEEDTFPMDTPLDDILPVERMDYVVDADSSQTIAIERVRANQSLVIQGPPGTGKSQTITNMIATAVLDGKKVLFVAEKNAALDVVLSRLKREGLDDLCLKLHSNITRSAVLEAIEKTWHLGAPMPKDFSSDLTRLEETRNLLNQHARDLHEIHQPSALSLFQVIGKLSLLPNRSKKLGQITIAGCEAWSPEQYRQKRQLLENLGQRAEEIGKLSEHPWHGVRRQQILPIDLPDIADAIQYLTQKVGETQQLAASLAEHILSPPPATLEDALRLLATAQHATQVPKLDPISLTHEGWNNLPSLLEIVSLGEQLQAAQPEINNLFNATALKVDAAALTHTVATHGKSVFRIFRREYRQAISKLKGITRSKPPKTTEQRLELCGKLYHYQNLCKLFGTKSSDSDFTFGYLWNGRGSDWKALRNAIDWVARGNVLDIPAHQRSTLALQRENRQFIPQTNTLATILQEVQNSLGQVMQMLELDAITAFGSENIYSVPMNKLIEQCHLWQVNMDKLPVWCTWNYRAREASDAGLEDYLSAIQHSQRLPAQELLDHFDRTYYEEVLRAMIQARPSLGRFEGLTHDKLIEDFRTLDQERMKIAKYRVLEQHHARMPARRAGGGFTGILLGELQRSRGQRTLRRLMLDTGPILQQIKPVFMMSPLSVAQYLIPGNMHFDLLIIDEASQVSPIDALGAFARTNQHVVVGDQKQLPPTRFFERMTGNEEEDKEEEPESAPAKDMESILSLCCTRMPETTLRWHYRSRHHSLIAVSNQEFYDNKLFIVPSPYAQSEHLGVKFRWLESGLYDRGKSSTNRIEAEAIAQAVLEHSRQHPEQSLGVAAFSSNQQLAIQDAIDAIRRTHPELETFLNDKKVEPFFVKNLETIQGDERDVIFISVGFGKDAHGRMSMNFGPLNGENGARRLNVLISRSRYRCEVFSSIRAEDIRISPDTGQGPRALQTFLRFAETGELTSLPTSQGEAMSPFETSVRQSLESQGYEVHSQIGVAGFFIDLAIADPEKPGRYIIGLECDGASYHSSLSARDRDRLRQTVLEAQGWVIHRIWSTEWFRNPQEQLRKAVAAIESARSAPLPTVGLSQPDKYLERIPADQTQLDHKFAPYELANISAPVHLQPHEVPSSTLEDILSRIIRTEGPIHYDELSTRIRELWGLRRTGQRVQAAISQGLRELEASGECLNEEGFLRLPENTVRARNREKLDRPSLRQPGRISPLEIEQGILEIIQAHPGIAATELTELLPRAFGQRSTTEQIRQVMAKSLLSLKASGQVLEENGILASA